MFSFTSVISHADLFYFIKALERVRDLNMEITLSKDVRPNQMASMQNPCNPVTHIGRHRFLLFVYIKFTVKLLHPVLQIKMFGIPLR